MIVCVRECSVQSLPRESEESNNVYVREELTHKERLHLGELDVLIHSILGITKRQTTSIAVSLIAKDYSAPGQRLGIPDYTP